MSHVRLDTPCAPLRGMVPQHGGIGAAAWMEARNEGRPVPHAEVSVSGVAPGGLGLVLQDVAPPVSVSEAGVLAGQAPIGRAVWLAKVARCARAVPVMMEA